MLRPRVASILDRGIDGERDLVPPSGGGESAIKGPSSWRGTEYGSDFIPEIGVARVTASSPRARGRCSFVLPAIAGDYVNARRATTST